MYYNRTGTKLESYSTEDKKLAEVSCTACVEEQQGEKSGYICLQEMKTKAERDNKTVTRSSTGMRGTAHIPMKCCFCLTFVLPCFGQIQGTALTQQTPPHI